MHVLSAAVPHRRAHGGRVFLALHRRPAQLRREPRHRARERARDRAHGFHGRAARVGEVLFRRHDRAEGKHAPAARRVRLGYRRRRADCRSGAGRPAGARIAQGQVHPGTLAGAEQRAQADRHSPRALSGHWRRADIARAGQVVPGAGPAHARGVGHDGDLRRLHRRAGRPHQARLHRPGGGFQPGAARPGDGRDSGQGAQRLQGLSQPARENRRDLHRRRLAAHGRRGYRG